MQIEDKFEHFLQTPNRKIMFKPSHPSRVVNTIEFQVLCHTHFGQELKICGNTAEFGNWNPLMAHKLVTDDSIYPIWKSLAPITIINPKTIEIKACIIANNTIAWQRNIENRPILCERPSLIEFCFNQSHFKITQKKVTQIQCRQGTWDILREMQGSQSSIDFKSNYPIESYFMHSRNSLELSHELSCSEQSSNFCSQNRGSEELPEHNGSICEFQRIDVNCRGPRNAGKSKSIRPHLFNMLPKRNRSKSRSLQRSDSGQQKKSQQPSSPYMIHIPSISHIQTKPKSKSKLCPEPFNTEMSEATYAKTQKEIDQTEIENVCKSIKQCFLADNEQNQDSKSTSTVTQYQTQDEYFTTRQCDVVIEKINSFDDL